jgi:hypothetical protein
MRYLCLLVGEPDMEDPVPAVALGPPPAERDFLIPSATSSSGAWPRPAGDGAVN